jgi:hypothetical protein
MRRIIKNFSKQLVLSPKEPKSSSRLNKEIRHSETTAPIHKCPEDVLLIVFYSIVGEDPKLATNLLFVCRQWYGIVVRAPRLWNHINVELGRSSCISTYSDTLMQHIMTCLQRSASSPLHIRLNLDDLPTKQTKPFEHPEGAMEAIAVLVGENGEHMKRWETVEITFPSYLSSYLGDDEGEDDLVVWENTDTMNEPIWRLFSYPAPNLTKLWIRGVNFPLQRLQPQEQFTTLQLESLTEFRINASPPRWDFLGLNFRSVTLLMLEVDTGSYHQTLGLSQFTHLRHLIIRSSWPRVLRPAPTTIRLPSLQTLSAGCYTPKTTTWDIPVLQMLELRGVRMSLDTVELPNVQASHVSWTSYEWNQKDPVLIQHHLQLLLSQYAEMRKLTVPSIARPIWEGEALTKQRGSRIVEVEFVGWGSKGISF